MAGQKKQETITFKADAALSEAMRLVPNRSEFIRLAILAALEGSCPLCKGTGFLTPDQQRHWQAFAKSHVVEQCQDCDAVHLVCEASLTPPHEKP